MFRKNFQQGIYSFWLLRMPLLLVYVLFFLIQLFFYFDNTKWDTRAGYAEVYTSAFQGPVHPASHIAAAEKKISNALHFKLKIRFNKKFQASVLDFPIVESVAEPAVYDLPLQIRVFANDTELVGLKYTHSLRGPPVLS